MPSNIVILCGFSDLGKGEIVEKYRIAGWGSYYHPEAHRNRAELDEWLSKLMGLYGNFVIETHSEVVVEYFRKIVRDGVMGPDEVGVFLVLSPKVLDLGLQANGDFRITLPEDYY